MDLGDGDNYNGTLCNIYYTGAKNIAPDGYHFTSEGGLERDESNPVIAILVAQEPIGGSRPMQENHTVAQGGGGIAVRLITS